jgi:hypothetical protein
MSSKYNARLAIIYSCLTCILLNTNKQVEAQNTSVAQMGYEYLLVATYEIPESGKSWMCRDFALIQEKVADKASFDKRRKEILQQYPGLPNVRFINPNQAVLAYEYEKKEAGWGCTKKVISLLIGKDLDILKNEMEKTMANRPSSPKIVFQRTAINDNGYYVVSQNWDGIEVKYRFAKSGSPGEFAVIQIKNPLTDKAATIAALRKSGINQVNLGKPFYEITLEPGMSANFTLKTPDDYILAMKFDKPGNTGEKEKGVIDWIKGYIRSQVIKDGKTIQLEKSERLKKGEVKSGGGVRG